MDLISNLMQQTSPLVLQIIFVLGVYTLIAMMYYAGSLLYNIGHALCSAISVTCCAMTSARQKSIATNTQYTASTKCMLSFLWKNFTLHLSAEGCVEYDSPDFRWNGIFDYDTYDNHTRKTVRNER